MCVGCVLCIMMFFFVIVVKKDSCATVEAMAVAYGCGAWRRVGPGSQIREHSVDYIDLSEIGAYCIVSMFRVPILARILGPLSMPF